MPKIFFLDEVDSTNEYLKNADFSEFTAVVARRQTAGKGSRGRSFVSNYGGLYMSIGVYPDKNIVRFLTPLAAVAVKRAVKNTLNIECKIKWVNDLVYKTDKLRKVCGILTESVTVGDRIKTVIGIGLNVFDDGRNFDGVKVAGFLQKGKIDYSIIEEIAQVIVSEFVALCSDVTTGMEEYAASSCLKGERVTYYRNDGDVVKGVVKGIDIDGGLIIEHDGQEEVVFDGEIKWTKLS